MHKRLQCSPFSSAARSSTCSTPIMGPTCVERQALQPWQPWRTWSPPHTSASSSHESRHSLEPAGPPGSPRQQSPKPMRSIARALITISLPLGLASHLPECLGYAGGPGTAGSRSLLRALARWTEWSNYCGRSPSPDRIASPSSSSFPPRARQASSAATPRVRRSSCHASMRPAIQACSAV
jgi:hypothetical protein